MSDKPLKLKCPHSTFFSGRRVDGKAVVIVHLCNANRELPLNEELKSCASEFGWGVRPAPVDCFQLAAAHSLIAKNRQLAIAILSYVAGDDAALRYHETFADEFIAELTFNSWVLTAGAVLTWLNVIETERAVDGTSAADLQGCDPLIAPSDQPRRDT